MEDDQPPLQGSSSSINLLGGGSAENQRMESDDGHGDLVRLPLRWPRSCWLAQLTLVARTARQLSRDGTTTDPERWRGIEPATRAKEVGYTTRSERSTGTRITQTVRSAEASASRRSRVLTLTNPTVAGLMTLL